MSRTSAGIQYNARSMNGIISINADEITCSGTITSDLIKANNLLEADTAETISGLWNFTTLPYSSVSATTGNQFTNKTYVDGAITSSLTNYVTLSTTQTITGAKTINANLRLNNTRNLIFGTTTGAVMNFTGANMYYDNQAGGGHYFFITGSPNLYIDSTGLNIESGKRIWFNGARCSITDNGTQLVYDVPTGNSHSFRTNNTQRVTISADTNGTLFTFPAGTIMREYTSFNWFLYQLPAGHTLKYQVGGVDIMEVSNGGALIYESLSMRNGKQLVWNEGFTNIAYLRKDTTTNTFDYEVATGYSHKFMVNSVTQLLLNTSGAVITGDLKLKFGSSIFPNDATGATMAGTGAGGFRFDADISADYTFYGDSTLLLTIGADGVVLNSTVVGAVPMPNNRLFLSANKANYIGSSTTDMRYNCSASGSHNFYQNGTTYLGFINQLGMTLSPNNTQLQMGTTGVVSVGHDSVGTALQYRVPATWVHNFQVGGVGVAQIRSEGFYSFQNNTSLRLGASSQIQIKHDTATSQIKYISAGAYSHMFYLNSTDLFYEMRADTFRALRGYQNKLGATGAYVSNNFNFSWNNPVAGLSVWIDTTRLGTMTISDYRVKECIVPARPVLERLCKVKMIEYEHKDISIFKKSGRHHGFIAHEFQELFPELNNIIAGEKDALTDDGKVQPQSIQPELTNLYLSAIQELNAKIEAQQKIIENQQKQIDQLIVLFSQSRV